MFRVSGPVRPRSRLLLIGAICISQLYRHLCYVLATQSVSLFWGKCALSSMVKDIFWMGFCLMEEDVSGPSSNISAKRAADCSMYPPTVMPDFNVGYSWCSVNTAESLGSRSLALSAPMTCDIVYSAGAILEDSTMKQYLPSVWLSLVSTMSTTPSISAKCL